LLSQKENTLTRSARDLSCDQAAALASKRSLFLSLSPPYQHQRASCLSPLFPSGSDFARARRLLYVLFLTLAQKERTERTAATVDVTEPRGERARADYFSYLLLADCVVGALTPRLARAVGAAALQGAPLLGLPLEGVVAVDDERHGHEQGQTGPGGGAKHRRRRRHFSAKYNDCLVNVSFFVMEF